MALRVDMIAQDQTLQKLRPVTMDRYDREPCLPGTRLDVIKFISDWVADPRREQNILWLHGVAGSGKSALSMTVANLYQELGRLGAYLFFSRHVAERSTPSAIIRTLAHQLALFDSRIGRAIAAAIHEMPDIIQSPGRLQFLKLLNEPLGSNHDIQSEGPIVIVLEALDECGSAEARCLLLEVLAEQFAKLPSVFRVIITSRPEYDIRHYFLSNKNILPCKLDITSRSTHNDIETFIQHRLRKVVQKNSLQLPNDWPGNRLHALVQRAAGLFVWASTACRFVDAYDPEQRLNALLQPDVTCDAEAALDKLYATALESAGEWTDIVFTADFRTIVGTILVIKNPLSAAALVDLLPFDGHRSPQFAISRLGCVLYNNAIIRILHPSFADFLSNKMRCKSDVWFIDMISHNLRVAFHCLDRLDVFLRFNVCNLRLSLISTDVYLPEDISYACVFWIEHVCLIKDASLVADRLETFLFKHLLHWFEAMSILKRSRDTITMLQRLRDWHAISLLGNVHVYDLVNDAHRFAQTFTGVIEEHPLNVYTTAIPFTPIETMLYCNFHDTFQFPRISKGADKSWSSLLMTLRIDEPGTHITFSPDGKQVLFSGWGHYRIYDTTTGAAVIAPIYDGTGQHYSACAFSPDGSWVVSAHANDEQFSLRMWDSQSGTEIKEPLHIGTHRVTFVVVSPSGELIACSTLSDIIYVWNVITGIKVSASTQRPKSISVLVFSPDSTRVIGGSYGGTVSAWDASSGTEILGLLQGHSSSILSIQIISDGRQIISVSQDQTVRVWDAISGANVLASSLQVMSSAGDILRAAFSPDGKQLVMIFPCHQVGIWDPISGAQIRMLTSGTPETSPWQSLTSAIACSPNGKIVASAQDNLLHLWDTAEPAELQTRAVQNALECTALSYSCDGTRIACAMLEIDLVLDQRQPTGTLIHVFDSMSGTEIYEPLQGHQDRITSLAFGPDESRIISGSCDRTIRLWDTISGTEIYAITDSHDLAIRSVAFSPDGRRIVSGSDDKTIRIWDVSSRNAVLELGPLRGHEDCVVSVAFSSDGTQIVSRSHDHAYSVYVWDAASGAQILGPLKVYEGDWSGDYLLQRVDRWADASVTFSPDGNLIGLYTESGLLREWDAITGATIESSHSSTILKCKPFDRFIVDKERYVRDTTTGLRLLRLPNKLEGLSLSASSQTSIAFSTDTDIHVVHFPPWMLLN
ncbi:hypothetical protein PILCRDRAFT_327664 [Piloderma croceum F 1598]|uniref:Nephrocystin 3-like N-terminal domain-containing protein n=1 Tax=Piloderma croceum (strain F 1598) TaxID=765440 RepID=A0A0C3G3I6_PILCF|nr:hypothetical protein PILCRDRAFT_327664 [Piloderma croceum F 1598]